MYVVVAIVVVVDTVLIFLLQNEGGGGKNRKKGPTFHARLREKVCFDTKRETEIYTHSKIAIELDLRSWLAS